jgi:predicted SnoaL-like aldol condensation-catalyzing enzyme
MDQDLEKNKQNAIEFYKMAFLGKPQKAIDLFVGDEYIQHNPLVGNGKKPFIDYFNKMANEYPNKHIEFVRTIAQDNLVALHTHQIWPDGDEYVTMDFFKFDRKGKIIEHWDAMQQIPEFTANGNTMY